MASDHDPLLPPPPSNQKGERYVGNEDEALGEDAVMRMIIPVGRSVWAIVSGYLGLISVLLIPAPFALATGIMAILDIKKNPKKHGMGRAIFGIVMGTLGSIAGTLLLIGISVNAIIQSK
jgi:Domain of unknown function (DUF4190)